MMKMKIWISVLFASVLTVSCDDTTGTIGGSLIDNLDHLEITTDTFSVETRSIVADSVLSRNVTGYLGKVRDPETGAYLSSDFMTQFYSIENFSFPKKDSIKSRIDGEVVADSCEIRLYYQNFYGDSLSTMKLAAYELDKPMPEDELYYSNFDPEKEGYVRNGGFSINKMYTLADRNVSSSKRNESDYIPNICIRLDKEYTDKDGKKYNNFGTYILRKYYENPADFKNAYTFIHNVVPGFYFKTKGGLGSMAYIYLSQLNVYFRHAYTGTTTTTGGEKKDTLYVGAGVAAFPGTEEVLQTSRIGNDKKTLSKLVADNSCTYIKSPAGIFTEMTLPVDEILRNHENDTINSAKVVLTRINSNSLNRDFALDAAQTLLMIPKSELYSFFELNKVADYKTSFIASLNSTYNTYTFNNIGSLIKYLGKNADRSKPDWNKVVIVPVTVTVNNTTGELTKVAHDMSMTSTRLVGGSQNPYSPLNISVIYSKFK